MSLPPNSPEHKALLNKLIRAFTETANAQFPGDHVNEIVITDACLNFCAQIICRTAVSRGAKKASAVEWAKACADLLPELVENNFERFKDHIEGKDATKQ